MEPDMVNSDRISIFKNNILKLMQPKPNRTFDCHNPQGIKLIMPWHITLRHLREHKLKHSFQDCLDPICTCRCVIETTTHYLLHCFSSKKERMPLKDKIRSIKSSSILEQNDTIIT